MLQCLFSIGTSSLPGKTPYSYGTEYKLMSWNLGYSEPESTYIFRSSEGKSGAQKPRKACLSATVISPKDIGCSFRPKIKSRFIEISFLSPTIIDKTKII